MGKIQLTNSDLKLIMNALDKKLKRLLVVKKETNHSIETTQAAIDRTSDLLYRLRVAKRSQ